MGKHTALAAQRDNNLHFLDFDFPFNPLPNSIITPINVNNLASALINYPDRNLANYLINGFTHGFDIGYSGSITCTEPRNLLSASQNPAVVCSALIKELERGHTSGPFRLPPFHTLHCSPLGAVPKKDGTHRIILDLSSPRHQSINDGISHDEFSVKYSSFDDAVDLVRQLGVRCEMGKLDIQHAFRLCPVNPSDWPLLGMLWGNHYFIDTRLPFGSRSSPYIFNTFADILTWILIHVYAIPYILHYLDDFFLADNTKKLAAYMEVMKNAFAWLGVPLAPAKIEGPTTRITYLGIEIDSVKFTIKLPEDKLHSLQVELALWVNRRSCTKKELLSLIGKLSFAAKVVKPGRMFLRRLIHLSTTVHSLHYRIYLNAEARADISWWIKFLPSWNGVSIIQTNYIDSNQLQLFTDASNLGFGAVYGNHWFSCPWPPSFTHHHINVKELFAIVAAVFTWGHLWHNKQILLFSDNLSVCTIWQSTSSRDKDLMFYLRHLFFFVAKRNINLLVKHVPGQLNISADLLSRLQVSEFKHHHPTASQSPTVIDPAIWNLSGLL